MPPIHPSTSASPARAGTPLKALSSTDAVAIIVGLIIGSGIFKFPQIVAQTSSSLWVFYGVWALGGLVSLMGALCYAELASAYPNAGGEYHFLQRAFGPRLSFLHAWSRLAVVTTTPIAILGRVFGDYASNLLSLGAHSSALYAALAVGLFTALNIAGIHSAKWAQNLFTLLEVGGVIAVTLTGIFLVAPPQPDLALTAIGPASGTPVAPLAGPWYAGVPLAMLFVLFTYGGWNDGAYISAELKSRTGIVRALVVSIGVVTVLYLLVNHAYVHSLGLAGMARSETVAADVMKAAFGAPGALFISLAVAVSTLTSVNSTIMVGARSNFALGRDWRIFGWLGHWDTRRDAPRNALILQGLIALILIAASEAAPEGLQSLVDYTMPVFWLFVTLVGIALFVLRRRDAARERPFRVPGYPLTPVVFILTSGFLCYSSLSYAGMGAWFGLAILLAGALLMALNRALSRQEGAAPGDLPR